MKSKILIYNGDTLNPNFYYYSKLGITHAFLILDGQKKTIITNVLNRGLKNGFNGDFVIAEDIFEETKKRLGKKFRVDSSIPLRIYKKICGKDFAEDATDELYKRRAKKTKKEISKIKKAVRFTLDIIEKFSRCENKSEKEIAEEIILETYKNGLEPAFLPIVATGKNASTPHALCTRKKIEDYVLIDYGVKYKKYCADVTRCYFFDTEKGKKLKEKYETLKKISETIVEKCGKMKSSKEISEYYQMLNKKAGFPAPLHSIGHGIGLEVHEYPRFGKKYNDDIIQTTFTIEPGVYTKEYGLRYENTVYHDGKRIVVL
ncbi:MAG: M24 family metallopeptidase [Candidatus Bilamarchaeaceae archaeon]